jgi:hypothetical protein
MANKKLFTKFASLAMAGALAFSAVPVGGLSGVMAATTASLDVVTYNNLVWGGGTSLTGGNRGGFTFKDIVSKAEVTTGTDTIDVTTSANYSLVGTTPVAYDDDVTFKNGKDYGSFEVVAGDPKTGATATEEFEIKSRDLGTAVVVGQAGENLSKEGELHVEYNGDVQTLDKNQISAVAFAAGVNGSDVTTEALAKTDYYYTQAAGKDADQTYTGTVTGLDKRVTGTQTVYMTIDQYDLSTKTFTGAAAAADGKYNVTVDVDNAVVGGGNPGVVVKAELKDDGKLETLEEGTDFNCQFENGGVGTDSGTVIITGAGNFTGTITENYDVVDEKNNIGAATVTVKSGTKNLTNGDVITYDGAIKKVEESEVKVMNDDGKTTKTLINGTDYRIEYEWDEKDEDSTNAWAKNPINAGVVTAKFIGEGDYAGELTATYTIEQADIDSNKTDISISGTYTFDGSAQEPDLDKSTGIVVKYNTNQIYGSNDNSKLQGYKVTYDNNVNAGTATANVMGVGNFKGVKTETFKISQLSIGKCEIKDIANQVFVEGVAAEPALEISYKNSNDETLNLDVNSDYTVEYASNTKVGTGNAKIKGAGNYTGSTTKSFKILGAEYDIANATVILTSDEFAYDGNYHSGGVKSVSMTGSDGKVTVLTNGTDYDVETATGKEVGEYNVTIKAKGSKYCGTVVKTFKITGYDVKDAGFSLKKTSVKYNGKKKTPELVVAEGKRYDGGTMTEGVDYEVSGIKGITNVGSVKVTVTGLNGYAGSTKTFTFKVTKADQPLKASGKKVTVKNVSKANQTIKAKNAYSVSKAEGKVTYKKTSGKGKITVNKSSGKITVKKGLKAGTYKVKVKITAAGNSNYKSGSKTVTVKITVK